MFINCLQKGVSFVEVQEGLKNFNSIFQFVNSARNCRRANFFKCGQSSSLGDNQQCMSPVSPVLCTVVNSEQWSQTYAYGTSFHSILKISMFFTFHLTNVSPFSNHTRRTKSHASSRPNYLSIWFLTLIESLFFIGNLNLRPVGVKTSERSALSK